MSEDYEINTKARVQSGLQFGCIFAVVGGVPLTEWTLAAVPICGFVGFAFGWRFAIPGIELIKPNRVGRAKSGLWLGPGSVACIILIRLTMALVGVHPNDSAFAALVLGCAVVLAFACHIFSFAEMVGSLGAATKRPRSAAAVLLLLYWVFMPAWVSLEAWRQAN